MSKKRLRTRNVLFSLIAALLVGAAIWQQLQLPPEQRTWHGRFAGIPYDFRMPTIERLRNAFWNENSSQLLVPQPFGMGWTINLYALLHPRAA